MAKEDAKPQKAQVPGAAFSSLVFSLTSRNMIIFLIFLTPFSLGNFGFNYIYITWAVLGITFLISFNNYFGQKKILRTNYIVPIVIFVASFFTSMLFGLEYKELFELTIYKSSKDSVFIEFMTFGPMQLILIYTIYVNTKNLDDIKIYILSILLSGILVNIISFLFLLSGRLVENRLGGTFDDTNYLGRFEVILIVVSLAYLMYGKLTTKYKIINLVLILVSANLLRLSSSRAAILALGFVIILMSLFSNSKALKYTLIVVSISVVAIFLAYAAAVKGALGAGFLTSFLDMSNATRLALNVAAFNIFMDYPVFGIGYHNFYNVYINHGYVPLDIPVVTTISVVHSWLFSVLAEQGLTGTISLFWILYLIFRDLVRSIKKTSVNDMKFAGIVLFGMNIAFYFFGLFSPVFFPELQYGVLCGLTGAYLKVFELDVRKSDFALHNILNNRL